MGTRIVDVVFTVAVALGWGAGTVICGAPVVKISQGELQGISQRSKDSPTEVLAFLGVPYAQPPIDNLRLALPQDARAWQGVRDATQHGPACIQMEAERGFFIYPYQIIHTGVSEDCLHLDIYTPDLQGRHAVMVYFHGGAFTYGKNSLLFNGTALAAHEGIVVVSVNYRVGALGFLHDADGAWPSNLGLRDQQFALCWVQENIAAFGGDPDRVTIAGQGSGAVCVSAHILSPSSEGLFHKAITQSGSILQPLAVRSSAAANGGAGFLNRLGCGDAGDKLACVRLKSTRDIIDAQEDQYFTAVFDDVIIPVNAEQRYAEGAFARVSYMSGVTRDEGFMNAFLVTPDAMAADVEPEQSQEQLKSFLKRIIGEDVEKVQEAVTEFYLPGDLEDHEAEFLVPGMARIVGDLLIRWPSYRTALHHAAKVPNTYFYEFSHQPSYMSLVRPESHSGRCDHGFDIVFTYGIPLVEANIHGSWIYREQEKEFTKTVMKYWANFVKNGTPNGEDLDEWKAFTEEEQNYMILQPEFKAERLLVMVDFWNGIMRDFRKDSSSHENMSEELHTEL